MRVPRRGFEPHATPRCVRGKLMRIEWVVAVVLASGARIIMRPELLDLFALAED